MIFGDRWVSAICRFFWTGLTMGDISRRLHGKLKTMSSGTPLPTTSKGRKPIPGTPDIATLIAEGMDPIHATYIFIHHIASSFAERFSQLPEMRTFTEDYVKAEESTSRVVHP